jgi:hypothetical protein
MHGREHRDLQASRRRNRRKRDIEKGVQVDDIRGPGTQEAQGGEVDDRIELEQLRDDMREDGRG